MRGILKTLVLFNASAPYSDRLLATGGATVGAYWKLANTSGTTATDATGNGFNGTDSNVTLNVAGVGDGLTATRFVPASNSFVNVYSTAFRDAFNGQEFSFIITFRMRAASVWLDATFRDIARFLVDGSNAFSITKSTAVNTIIVTYIAGGTNKTIRLISNSTDWITLGVTVSKAGDAFKIYANGVQVVTTQTGLGTWAGTLSSTRTVLGATSTVPTLVHDGDLAHARYLPGVVLTDAQMLYATIGTGQYVDLDGAVAVNAAAALTTPTYDGSGEGIHPDVIDFGSVWNGYRYWMAMTPFPGANQRLENPSILVSNDKTTWIVPPGLTNPLDPDPFPGLHADTELVMDGNTMWCIYREEIDPNVTLYGRSTTDGINWNARVVIATGIDNNYLVSPAIVWDGTQWVMFSVFDTTVNVVHRQTASAITGPWSAPATVSLTMPLDEVWHINVILADGILYMAMSTVGRVGLLCVSFDDGLSWVFAGTRTMLPSGGVGKWDTSIYRMSIVRTSTGLDMWYSAYGGSSPFVWHTGFTTVPL